VVVLYFQEGLISLFAGERIQRWMGSAKGRGNEGHIED
jgi:uncharacterized membrane protein